jgi:hypothetical protein
VIPSGAALLDERYWRDKADEIRRIAQAAVEPLVKSELSGIASSYERIAKLIKTHQAKTPK